ncbi:kinesin-like protein KIF11 [Astyanax mexicanus]|uniref:Kinesin-like protein KIF11 n=1 Tax=Astyanax mexicanus TaxID=7994 RepID=A0A8T2L9X9_ASTMX|nr:kinesin-like protein KIF11 [Astyanax mexicanus]XP_022528477.2 kinesin-like protein KIF11 [Astyanax mexicanus]KAG9268420.1 kinesin-like protein KIF11 [Astyanax mexicanus]
MSSNSGALSAKKDEKGRNIQVVVRCRPFNAVERKSNSHGVIECDQTRKEVLVRTGGVTDKTSRKTYTFDMVFGPSAKQIEVYRSVVCPILDEVILGYNCTVFAYGQTGTGKTFTMEGERSPNEEFTWEEDPLAGIIPRTLHQIFEKLASNGTEFSVKVSLLEIYNEELFDLLSPSPDVTERLQLFDDPRNKRGVIVKGLEEVTVHNKNEVYQILERGAAKRKTASTLMNAYSSRSHSVFSVTIHMKEITLDGEELVKIGKLNLVDLAGSENIGRSGAVDKRAREAGNINQSLLTLGRVITALVERGPHVPYRESKLTRILQDSLGGRTKTSIIATVSPASINLEETLSTLDYANRAKNIMNKPEVNQKLTKRTLIKEYTEEIERLKRDLAATRDKHGVYLSPENYESMNSRIVGQEEQITEYTERIAAVEEELKQLIELFSDSKQKLEQCTDDLQDKTNQLQEAHKDLEETRHRLTQEEFITSRLQTTEEQLFSTAGQLLSTAEASTSDVGGLHAKLQRVRAVEQHNSTVQSSFTERMEQSCNSMHTALQEQSLKQTAILDYYRHAVADLLGGTGRVFEESLGSVLSSYSAIKEVVGKGVDGCKSRLLQQENLTQENRDSMLQLLDQHKSHLEEVLIAQAMPGIRSVIAMNDSLKDTLQKYSALAAKMEGMKAEMTAFFSGHTEALMSMREAAVQGLSSLHDEHEKLKQQINQASSSHQTRVSQLLKCMQDQMNLLALNTQTDFEGLQEMSDAQKAPVETLKNTIQSKCVAAEDETTSVHSRLISCTDDVISGINDVTEEGQRALEESSGYCGLLQSSLDSLADSGLQWCHTVRDSTEKRAQEQLTNIAENKASVQALLEDVERRGQTAVEECRSRLAPVQQEMEQVLKGVEMQTGRDQVTLQEHRDVLSSLATEAMDTVNNFVSNELQKDLPTGTTPQRKEYKYPRILDPLRSRTELEEEFRAQQEQLTSAFSQCDALTEGEEEEKQVEQDSLEDEVSGSSDSSSSQPSVPDQDKNLVCYEEGRVPFFKQKKAKKENPSNKSLNRSKVAENDSMVSSPRSRLPLRAQNQ